MRVLVPFLACATLAACRTSGPTSQAELEVALQDDARSVSRGPLVTLYSPYDAAGSAPYAIVVEREAELVRALLSAGREPPVRLYLVPAPAPDEPWHAAHRDGVHGGAFHRGFAFVYVHPRGEDAHVRAELEQDALRHELAHVYARRADLTRAKWFDEGLASEIESMAARAGALHEHPFPPALLAARAQARSISLAELLAWSAGERLSAAELAPRYALAQSLLRFLISRAAGATWRERLHEVRTIPDEALLRLETQWLEWLHGLDALSAVRRGASSADPVERTGAASLLPVLAEIGAPELATRAADELALELLADPSAGTGAARFLVFFRAPALAESDLATLESATDPVLRLAACALRARRGDPVDTARARAAWTDVAESERWRCRVLVAALPEFE